MASRKLEDLTPDLEHKARELIRLAELKGLKIVVTRTACARVEQEALYAQGRETTESVNEKRRKVCWASITDEQNKRCVTWTMNSRHIVDRVDQKALAFDIMVVKGKEAVWDVKVDVNEDGYPDYQQVGELGEMLGLVWGGRWTGKKRDCPHFQ